MKAVYNTDAHVGWFYSWGRGSADGILLACQLVGILFVIGWVVGTMAPFFWMLHYFGYLRADSLEEVVGLDIGYTGGHPKRHDDLDQQMHDKMDEYIKEYEHRQREKALRKANEGRRNVRNSPLPASSIHSHSLHGSSYHGRRIISSQMIESLDTISDGNQRTNGTAVITSEEPDNSGSNQERAV